MSDAIKNAARSALKVPSQNNQAAKARGARVDVGMPQIQQDPRVEVGEPTLEQGNDITLPTMDLAGYEKSRRGDAPVESTMAPWDYLALGRDAGSLISMAAQKALGRGAAQVAAREAVDPIKAAAQKAWARVNEGSPALNDVLGARPWAGRMLKAAEQNPGAAPEAEAFAARMGNRAPVPNHPDYGDFGGVQSPTEIARRVARSEGRAVTQSQPGVGQFANAAPDAATRAGQKAPRVEIGKVQVTPTQPRSPVDEAKDAGIAWLNKMAGM